MAPEIFISYSSNDKVTADAVCHALEEAGLRCWIAPRDASPGVRYQGSIIRAIRECQAMVLMFSAASNSSEHVFRELHAASEHGKPVIPFRIDNITPSDELSYYLGPLHWLDALTPPIERHIERLVQALSEFVRQSTAIPDQAIVSPAAPTLAEPEPEPVPPQPHATAETLEPPPHGAAVVRESAQRHDSGHTSRPSEIDTLDRRGVPRSAADVETGVKVRALPTATPMGRALFWSLSCGLLAATAVYAMQLWSPRGLAAVSITEWVDVVLRYASPFLGMGLAVQLRGDRLRTRVAGVIAGGAIGVVAWWLYSLVV